MMFARVILLAILCVFIPVFKGCQDPETQAIASCDNLVAHPNDSSRLGAGVPDDQVAIGRAIDACERAVKIEPENPRLLFQLGRAYWLAKRDRAAFATFVKSAKQQYGAAEKYIGDAYLEGRGLSEGEEQSAKTARVWYANAGRDGFSEANKAMKEAQVLDFDSDVFQVPRYMQSIYDKDFSQIESRAYFMGYLRGFIEELGGDKILYVDSNCKPLVTALGQAVLMLGQGLAYLESMKSKKDLVAGGISLLGSPVSKDQGERDAVILVNRYHCDSEIARRITQNVGVAFKEYDSGVQSLSKRALDAWTRGRKQ